VYVLDRDDETFTVSSLSLSLSLRACVCACVYLRARCPNWDPTTCHEVRRYRGAGEGVQSINQSISSSSSSSSSRSYTWCAYPLSYGTPTDAYRTRSVRFIFVFSFFSPPRRTSTTEIIRTGSQWRTSKKAPAEARTYGMYVAFYTRDDRTRQSLVTISVRPARPFLWARARKVHVSSTGNIRFQTDARISSGTALFARASRHRRE